jgi:hypothetical protein
MGHPITWEKDMTSSTWTTVWTLPNPANNSDQTDNESTIHIHVDEHHLRHIYNEHISPACRHERGMWGDALPDTLVSHLDACWDQTEAQRNQALNELSSWLYQQVHVSFERPRLVSYQQFADDASHLHDTWETVTPSGVVVVFRHYPDCTVLQTAYIPKEAHSERPHRRWLASVRNRGMEYTLGFNFAGRTYQTPPSAEETFVSNDPRGWRTAVDFLTLRTWGFREMELPGFAGSHWIWTGKPLPWSS